MGRGRAAPLLATDDSRRHYPAPSCALCPPPKKRLLPPAPLPPQPLHFFRCAVESHVPPLATVRGAASRHADPARHAFIPGWSMPSSWTVTPATPEYVTHIGVPEDGHFVVEYCSDEVIAGGYKHTGGVFARGGYFLPNRLGQGPVLRRGKLRHVTPSRQDQVLSWSVRQTPRFCRPVAWSLSERASEMEPLLARGVRAGMSAIIPDRLEGM